MSSQSTDPILNILAIDDNPQFLRSLALDGRRCRCRVIPAGSLEEAQEIIEERGIRSLDGVILDILCMRTRDQAVEDRSFLQAALDYFKAQAADLPRIVVTGDQSTFEIFADIFAEERLVQKGTVPNEAIFRHLRQQAERTPINHIRRTYSDVLDVFDRGHLDNRTRAELLETLLEVDASAPTAIRDNLARIRRIQEAIYIAMSKVSVDWIPVSLFTFDGEHIALRPVLRHLMDKGYHHAQIKDFAYCIYSVASDNGSHTPYANADHEPTRYTVRATVFMLLDLILWFGSLMDARQ